MRIVRQIYYCGVSGTLAGLVAWLVIGRVGAAQWPNLWLAGAFVGSGVGGLLVLSLTVTRGYVERWRWSRLMNKAAIGTAVGAVAGMVGMLLGQSLFLVAEGEWLGRIAGWLCLSLLVGVAQAGRDASARRLAVGGAAGLVSGLLCGLAYEGLTQQFLARSAEAQMWASAFGLMLIGGLFAAGIPAAERLASRAVVVVRTGRRAGMEYLLLDRLFVGSSEECHVLIPDDPGVEPRHAELRIEAGVIRIRNLGRTSITLGGKDLPPGGDSPCPGGAGLRIGQTELRIL